MFSAREATVLSHVLLHAKVYIFFVALLLWVNFEPHRIQYTKGHIYWCIFENVHMLHQKQTQANYLPNSNFYYTLTYKGECSQRWKAKVPLSVEFPVRMTDSVVWLLGVQTHLKYGFCFPSKVIIWSWVGLFIHCIIYRVYIAWQTHSTNCYQKYAAQITTRARQFS